MTDRSVRGVDSTILEDAVRSRPSKTNCTSPAEAGETAETGVDDDGPASWERHWWRRKNELVRQFVDERPQRAARPISVRDDGKIREDAAAERVEDGYRAKTWSLVFREFLTWYNGYRHAHLMFEDPDGEPVRAPMPNSHQPAYGDKYYAKLKALEKMVLREFDRRHVVMLTLSGSSKNANGGWRCPADHLRDVVNSWRPDDGRGVYHALRDAVGHADRWEYALVTEHHQSGYGHVHVAVFVDGVVDEQDFYPVVDAHLRNCTIAGPDAHNYHDDDTISVREVDPDLQLHDLEAENVPQDRVGNLASYISEYIGAYGEELFDRSLEELTFRAACWATGTQRVRFSNGANDLISQELDERDDGGDYSLSSESFGWVSGADEEDVRDAVDPDGDLEVDDVLDGERGWSVTGIERVTEEGAELYGMDRDAAQYVELENASHLDPPKQVPYGRPRPSTEDAALTGYADD